MASQDVLKVLSGAPGLPGPYLKELYAPYRIFDRMGNKKPFTVLAITDSKRRLLSGQCPRSTEFAVRLWAQDHCVVLDCDLHHQEPVATARIKGGPQPGHYHYHELRGSCSPGKQLAYDIYCDVLAPFSDVVLIRVQELGGTQETVRFLCHWMRHLERKKWRTKTRVVLISNGLSLQNFEFDLITALLEGRTDTQSASAAKQRIMDSFDVELMIDPVDNVKLRALARRGSYRKSHGLDLTAVHTKRLLQASIAHFAECPAKEFDMVAASRTCRPVPASLALNVADFLSASVAPFRYCDLIASALAMDAFPTHMHRKLNLDWVELLLIPETSHRVGCLLRFTQSIFDAVSMAAAYRVWLAKFRPFSIRSATNISRPELI